MDVLEAIYERRAVRAYLDRPIDRPTLEKLLQAAVQAPSAANFQPWAFAVLQDRARLRAYSDRAKMLLLAGDPRDPRTVHLRELLQSSPDYNIFYNARTLVIVCAAAGPQAAEDCCLAGQNFMLAAHALGLGTCPIGFARPLLSLPDVKAELGIPPEWAPVLPLILGFPSARPPAVPRQAPRLLSWA